MAGIDSWRDPKNASFIRQRIRPQSAQIAQTSAGPLPLDGGQQERQSSPLLQKLQSRPTDQRHFLGSTPLPTNGPSHYRNISADGSARQHVGNVYNQNSYHYTLRQRRSDETLREDQRSGVLLKAAAEGQTPRIKRLLKLGADTDYADESSGYTALHHAVLSGFEDVVEGLLEAGADVNAQSHSNFTRSISRRSKVELMSLSFCFGTAPVQTS